jgi:branched-chain amino acid transport system ATP-binding protein
MKTILSVEHVSANYKDLVVLSDVSFEVEQGKIVALLGQNGAGKSTLLKVIIGVVSCTGGKTKVRGTIGYVPQGKRVFPLLTVKENVLLVSDGKVIPEWLIKLFPILGTKENKLARDLSGGEQQMVALARGLIGKPDLLLLDEPSLGLSPKLVKDVFTIIDTIRREYGTTMIIVEHNLTSLLAIADKGYVLEKGSIVRVFESDALKNSTEVYQSLLGITQSNNP